MNTVLTSHLVELAKKRSQEFSVEGFVYGQGPINPKFLLVGEAPGETEAVTVFLFLEGRVRNLCAFLNY